MSSEVGAERGSDDEVGATKDGSHTGMGVAYP